MKMYLHLGQDTIVMTDRIIGVFDLDNSTSGLLVSSLILLTNSTCSFKVPSSVWVRVSRVITCLLTVIYCVKFHHHHRQLYY